MRFKTEEHKERYLDVLSHMQWNDCYHRAAAYLMALVPMCYQDVFDFERDAVKPEGLYKAWQTNSSRKATRLMYNLWGGIHVDLAADEPAETSGYYAVDEIFYNSEYAPYFYEAVRIRYEWV